MGRILDSPATWWSKRRVRALSKPSRFARRLLASLLAGAFLAAGGCDGDDPDGDVATSAEEAVGAVAGALAATGDTDPAVTPAEPPPADSRDARATNAEAVVGMAHDVRILELRLAGESVADLARVESELVVAVALRHGFRLERWALEDGAPPRRRGATTHDAVDATAPTLAALEDGSVIAAWNEAGTLRAAVMAPQAHGELIAVEEALAPYLATETHALVGPPTLTLTEDAARPLLLCAQETARGLICGFMSAGGVVEAWHPIGKLREYGPIEVAATEGGFVGLAGRCLDESCAVRHLVTLHLDADARPDRRRGTRALAKVQGRRPIVAVRAEGGLFVSARRTRAQLTTAWHVTRGPTRERDGVFSRVIGAIFLPFDGPYGPGETWLLEESPLTMRGGFPVGLVRPSRWSPAVGREEAISWPTDAHDALPGAPGQRVLTRGGVIGLLPAHRGGEIAFTCLLLTPNEAPRAVPVPREDSPPRKRRTRR